MAAESGNVSLQLHPDSTPLFPSLYPVPILSQNLNSTSNINRLCLIPEVDDDAEADLYVFLRGPRYAAYSELRESWLRKKHREHYPGEEIRPVPAVATPPRKHVKFHNLAVTQNSNSHLAREDQVPSFVESGRVRGRKVSSVVAQSVPDFSAALRKENRRPAAEITLTPPSAKKGSTGMGNGLSAKGSKSASAAEKRGGGVVVRKSYASLEELRGSSVRAVAAICVGAGDSRRRILGSRRF